MPPPPSSSTSWPRRPTNDACPASSPATGGSTCSASTSSATSSSTAAAPSCCSRSSPNAMRRPASPWPPTSRSASGARSSPSPASSLPSSTGSPSTLTSSRPAPTATDCARRGRGHARRARDARSRRTLHPSTVAIGPQNELQGSVFQALLTSMWARGRLPAVSEVDSLVGQQQVDRPTGEHDQGEGGVGGVEAEGSSDDQPHPVVEPLDAAVVDAEPDGGDDAVDVGADGAGQLEEGLEAAASGS